MKVIERIGICSTDFPVMPVDALFARIRGHGMTAVQLSFASLSESNYAPTGCIEIPERVADETLRAVSEAAQRHGITLTALNGTYNMAHPDTDVRRAGLACLKTVIEAAAALACPMVTLCSGTRNRAHLWRPHADNAQPSAWDDMLASMRAAADIAERAGITLAVETEAANIIDTPEKARALIDAVASPRLKMIMDCANLFHAGEAKRENARAVIAHAFALFGGDVVLAHGKDIRESEGIVFCSAGEGIVDYPFFLRQLAACGYHGDMIVHGIDDEGKIARALALVAG